MVINTILDRLSSRGCPKFQSFSRSFGFEILSLEFLLRIVGEDYLMS